MRYLRHKQDGFIYEWNPILAKNEMCEEVTEAEAYPERFITPEVADRISNVLTSRKGKRGGLNLSTPEVLLEEKQRGVDIEIREDASTGL